MDPSAFFFVVIMESMATIFGEKGKLIMDLVVWLVGKAIFYSTPSFKCPHGIYSQNFEN